MAEKIFSEGIFYYDKRKKAPDFVIGSLSVNVDRFRSWVSNQKADQEGYIRLNILRSRGGKPYIELDTWEKPAATVQPAEPQSKKLDEQYKKLTDEAPDPKDIPFN